MSADDRLAPPRALALHDALDPEAELATLSLAELVERFGAGLDRYDESFAREVARALHDRAAHVRLPAVDRVGLDDVVATLSMDRRMRLVVTGDLAAVRGSVTMRWDEADFPYLPVTLHAEPVAAPYTFATLDFSVRGRRGTLLAAAPPLPEGQVVTVRALATIGDTVEYRVTGLGTETSVPVDALSLTP